MLDDSYIARNEAGRERLREIVARLSEDDYSREVGHGWSVAAALGHLAFWDRRALASLEEWERSGKRPERADSAAINEAMLAQWTAAPPGEAAREAVAAAEAVDRKIAGLLAELRETILDAGYPRLLDRSLHRQEHLEEIERAVSSG